MSKLTLADFNYRAHGPLPWHAEQFASLQHRARSGDLAHAYLLGGEAGIGKRAFAQAFAASLLCAVDSTNSASPCGQCSECQLIRAGSHPDLLWIAPEESGKDIKVDQIRQLGDFIARSSHGGRARVVLINEVDRLNGAAANALLKTLEEPGRSCYLLLISSMPGSLLATLRSRCQRLNLAPAAPAAGEKWLADLDLESEDRLMLSRAIEQLKSLRGDIGFMRPLQFFADVANGGELTGGQSRLGEALSRLWQSGSGAAGLLRGELAAMAKGSKLGDLDWIGYVHASSSIVIRFAITGQVPDEADAAQRQLCELLGHSTLDSRFLLHRLAAYQQQLEVLRRQQLSAANPNPQLMQESLLWQWSRLLRTG